MGQSVVDMDTLQKGSAMKVYLPSFASDPYGQVRLWLEVQKKKQVDMGCL